MKNNIDKSYTNLLQDILDNGVNKKDRTGTGTLSVFGRQIRHKMSEGFPLLTTKQMAWKSIVVELLWFLRGDTNIQWLLKHGCDIWTGDAYKYYVTKLRKKNSIYPRMSPTDSYTEKILSRKQFVEQMKFDNEFAEEWGDLGPIYGRQWREWDEDKGGIDQIKNLIDELKTNPDSRRLIVTAWNPTYIPHMKLPPCHYGFQLYSRELSWEEFDKIAEERLDEKDYKTHLQYRKLMVETKIAIENQEFEKVAKVRDKVKPLQEKLEPILETFPTRALSLMWNQRSVDTFLGLPFNIASYGLLLQIIAQQVNMLPDELIGNLGDTHLYQDHLNQAKEQIGREYTIEERLKLHGKSDAKKAYEAGDYVYMDVLMSNIPYRTREPFELPQVKIKPFENFETLSVDDFELIGYQSHDKIVAPLSN